MALSSEEKEELATIYASMKNGSWNLLDEDRRENEARLDEAMWAALCHATSRAALFVSGAYPNSPQARFYELMSKALQ